MKWIINGIGIVVVVQHCWLELNGEMKKANKINRKSPFTFFKGLYLSISVILFFSCSFIYAENSEVYLGVISSNFITDGIGGVPFFGNYSGNIFNKITDTTKNFNIWHSFLNSFPKKAIAFGITTSGKSIRFTVSPAKKPEGLYEALINTIDMPKNGNIDKPILFATKDSLFSIKSSKPTDFPDISFANNLEIEVRKLFKEAIQDRSDDEKFAKIQIKKPSCQFIQFETKDYYSVLFPLKLSGAPYDISLIDDRAVAFFLINYSTKKVLLSSFGHPEWSPNSTKVKTIRPYFFFQIKGMNKLLCFADYSYAWESIGYAIIDVSSGKVLLETM